MYLNRGLEHTVDVIIAPFNATQGKDRHLKSKAWNVLCLFHSPCYIDKDSDLEVAAKRLCWGKFANSGQVQLQ